MSQSRASTNTGARHRARRPDGDANRGSGRGDDWAGDHWGGRGEGGHGQGGLSRTGGAEGNGRLTAMTGAVLLVLFAAEGVTILSVHRLLTLHFFLGMLIAGPVLLKIAATCYRFTRYYTRDPSYVRKGPPALLLRLLGPVVIIMSCGVIGSGIMLALTGPQGAGPWLLLHKASFVLWFGAMTIHVIAHAPRLARLLGAGPRQRAATALGGAGARWLLLTGALGSGLLLAVLTLHLTAPWHQ
ncbi:MAG: hypothetical protein ABSA03_13795 [Streptosporangiaceae bacterium]